MGEKNEEKKLKKRKLHIQRTKILIRYSTHASPSNNFYLNKQSAIVSNPTYKRTTYFSRLTNWTVIPLKIEDTSARLIPPRATILLPWYLNLDRERERVYWSRMPGYECIMPSAHIALNSKCYLPNCTSLLHDSFLVNLSPRAQRYCTPDIR